MSKIKKTFMSLSLRDKKTNNKSNKSYLKTSGLPRSRLKFFIHPMPELGVLFSGVLKVLFNIIITL